MSLVRSMSYGSLHLECKGKCNGKPLNNFSEDDDIIKENTLQEKKSSGLCGECLTEGKIGCRENKNFIVSDFLKGSGALQENGGNNWIQSIL